MKDKKVSVYSSKGRSWNGLESPWYSVKISNILLLLDVSFKSSNTNDLLNFSADKQPDICIQQE